MADIILDVIVPKPPLTYYCTTVDCTVLFFNGEQSAICPGCWQISISVVKQMQYTIQDKDF